MEYVAQSTQALPWIRAQKVEEEAGEEHKMGRKRKFGGNVAGGAHKNQNRIEKKTREEAGELYPVK